LNTDGWREIIDFAGEVLDAHGWRGIEARYDVSEKNATVCFGAEAA